MAQQCPSLVKNPLAVKGCLGEARLLFFISAVNHALADGRTPERTQAAQIRLGELLKEEDVKLGSDGGVRKGRIWEKLGQG